jgi:lipoate-protein ligase A
MDPRWQGRALVRRPTGGGAIWHHHELTYAIAIPPDCPLVRPNTALYRAVHGAIAEVLADRGIPAQRRGEEGGASRIGEERPLLCFTGRDPEDIVWENHKLVGSAQRRRDGAVLQHGSVLLARSPGVPELLGVCDVAELHGSPEQWEEPFKRRLIAALDLEPIAIDVPEPLRARALELERSIYRDPAWTESR